LILTKLNRAGAQNALAHFFLSMIVKKLADAIYNDVVSGL
jgi:hypothetical protein